MTEKIVNIEHKKQITVSLCVCLLSTACACALVSDRSFGLTHPSDFLARLQGNGALGIVLTAALYALFSKSLHTELSKRVSKCTIAVASVFAIAESIGFNIDQYSSLQNPSSDSVLLCRFTFSRRVLLCHVRLNTSNWSRLVATHPFKKRQVR